MAILLVGSLLTVLIDLVAVFRGVTTTRGSTAFIPAVLCFWCAVRFPSVFGWLVRIGVAIFGWGSAVRSCTYYLHASRDIQRLAGINERMLHIVGCTLIVAGAIQWFHARPTDT